MKLAYSPASPYARKVVIVAMEAGLDSKIERIPTAVRPDQPNLELGKDNPLMQVPTLTTEGGETLYDSRVICAYLDLLNPGPKMIPASGGERWAALRLESLGDGITDAGILVRYETALRPEALRWKEWIDGQAKKVDQGLDLLEAHPEMLTGPLNIGQIAVACGIGWLNFRAVFGDCLAKRPKLAAWYAMIGERPSFKATTPKAAT
jgi:glutathione S-transferase